MTEALELSGVLDFYDVQHNPDRMKQMASCPFHDDNHPSLSINLTESVWRCHSCGEAGDGYTLIMKKEGVNFVGARTFAAANNFTAGSSGGGDDLLPTSVYRRRPGDRGLPTGTGNDEGDGGYVPRWRRS